MAHSDTVRRLLAEQQLREQQEAKHIEYMFSLIPNVVEVLGKLLQMPEEEIKWLEISISDDVLIMGVAVKFPSDDIPMFVQIFAPSSVKDVGDEQVMINQLIRVGLPLSLVDRPVQDIIQFFHDLATGIDGDDDEESGLELPPVESDSPSTVDQTFDSSELTLEQTQKLLLFQHHTSEVKH